MNESNWTGAFVVLCITALGTFMSIVGCVVAVGTGYFGYAVVALIFCVGFGALHLRHAYHMIDMMDESRNCVTTKE